MVLLKISPVAGKLVSEFREANILPPGGLLFTSFERAVDSISFLQH